MAVTATHLTTGGTVTDATSFDTASISPSAYKLVLVAVYANVSSGPANAPTVTGASMTWTQVRTTNTPDTLSSITLFRALSAAPGSGALTIDFAGQTQGNCAWSIAEFGNVDISGTNGAGAVVQSADNDADSSSSTTLVVTLGAFASAGNATYGAFGKAGTAAMTAGSGFTQLGQTNPGRSFMSEWRVDNDTSVDVTWASEVVTRSGVAAEIKAKVGGGLALLGVG